MGRRLVNKKIEKFYIPQPEGKGEDGFYIDDSTIVNRANCEYKFRFKTFK